MSLKKLLYFIPFLFSSLSWADYVTSGYVGLLIPTTGTIDTKRQFTDKINGNFVMLSASMTTLSNTVAGMSSSTNALANFFNTQDSTSDTRMNGMGIVFSSNTSLLSATNTWSASQNFSSMTVRVSITWPDGSVSTSSCLGCGGGSGINLLITTSVWSAAQTFSSATINSNLWIIGNTSMGTGAQAPTSALDISGGSLTLRESGSNTTGIIINNPYGGDGKIYLDMNSDNPIDVNKSWAFVKRNISTSDSLNFNLLTSTKTQKHTYLVFERNGNMGFGTVQGNVSGNANQISSKFDFGGGSLTIRGTNAGLSVGSTFFIVSPEGKSGFGTSNPSSIVDIENGSITVKGNNSGINVVQGTVTASAINSSSFTWNNIPFTTPMTDGSAGQALLTNGNRGLYFGAAAAIVGLPLPNGATNYVSTYDTQTITQSPTFISSITVSGSTIGFQTYDVVFTSPPVQGQHLFAAQVNGRSVLVAGGGDGGGGSSGSSDNFGSHVATAPVEMRGYSTQGSSQSLIGTTTGQAYLLVFSSNTQDSTPLFHALNNSAVPITEISASSFSVNVASNVYFAAPRFRYTGTKSTAVFTTSRFEVDMPTQGVSGGWDSNTTGHGNNIFSVPSSGTPSGIWYSPYPWGSTTRDFGGVMGINGIPLLTGNLYPQLYVESNADTNISANSARGIFMNFRGSSSGGSQGRSIIAAGSYSGSFSSMIGIEGVGHLNTTDKNQGRGILFSIGDLGFAPGVSNTLNSGAERAFMLLTSSNNLVVGNIDGVLPVKDRLTVLGSGRFAGDFIISPTTPIGVAATTETYDNFLGTEFEVYRPTGVASWSMPWISSGANTMWECVNSTWDIDYVNIATVSATTNKQLNKIGFTFAIPSNTFEISRIEIYCRFKSSGSADSSYLSLFYSTGGNNSYLLTVGTVSTSNQAYQNFTSTFPTFNPTTGKPWLWKELQTGVFGFMAARNNSFLMSVSRFYIRVAIKTGLSVRYYKEGFGVGTLDPRASFEVRASTYNDYSIIFSTSQNWDGKNLVMTSTNAYVGAGLYRGDEKPSSAFDVNNGSITIRGVNAGLSITGITQGKAICFNSANQMSVCTSAVGADGTCTCP